MPRCAVLVSALLDLTLEAPSLRLNASADPAFDIARLRRRVERYAAGADPADPLLSPLYGNLHGLPPVKLLAAGPDPLLDDSLAFAARAARSGVHVDLRVRPDAADLRGAVVADLAAFAEAWTSVARPSRTD
jgi:epsilon-lactone hydrolase